MGMIAGDRDSSIAVADARRSPSGQNSTATPLPNRAFPGPLNTKQKLEAAKQLLIESENNYSWVAGQLGINPSTLWRWRRAGKIT